MDASVTRPVYGQLSALSSTNTSEMVKEINFGLASLVQRQQKHMRDIERKYAPQRAALLLGGAAGVGLAANAAFLPSLSPLLGLAVPASAAAGARGGALLGYGQAKLCGFVEKRSASRSMLGVLAACDPDRKADLLGGVGVALTTRPGALASM